MSFLIEAMVKPSSLQAFAHRPALVRSKCGFENRIKNTFFIRSVSAYRELLIAAVLVVIIVQHRTSVLDKTACVWSKTRRVEHTMLEINIHYIVRDYILVHQLTNIGFKHGDCRIVCCHLPDTRKPCIENRSV